MKLKNFIFAIAGCSALITTKIFWALSLGEDISFIMEILYGLPFWIVLWCFFDFRSWVKGDAQEKQT